eukprot:9185900-Ditylum_brightwellii.AAC.1
MDMSRNGAKNAQNHLSECENNEQHSVDEDSDDGITLSPVSSIISGLTMPTCLQSRIGSDSESAGSTTSSSSDEEGCAVDFPITKKRSEASSSQASEAATPLINSA